MIDTKYFLKGFKSIKGVGSPAIALGASFVAIGALLKNLGLGVGAITLTPAVSSLLHSCTDGTSWNPVFFNKSQIKLLLNLTEQIIPSDDKIPGAKELNLIKFIDLYILNMINYP